MPNNYDEEQEKLREKRELLKLKQGLVEESDILEEKHERITHQDLKGWAKVSNFLYHNKVPLIVLTVAALAVGYITWQTITRERNDLYILAVTTDNASGLYTKLDDIETTFEKYCPDYDGNGYVHVGVNYINLSTAAGVSQYSDSENYKFSSEVFTGDSQMYITDQGIIELMNEMANGEVQFFVDFSEQYPDAVLYENQGLQVNTSEFAKEARWTSCPDIVGIYVRDEFKNMTGNDDGAKEQRRRALEVFNNIVTGNIVNPDNE